MELAKPWSWIAVGVRDSQSCFIQNISEGRFSPVLLNFCPHAFELKIVANSQVTQNLKGATSELEEAFLGAPVPMAEGASAGKEGAVDKFSFAQGRLPQPTGTSLWVQHQMTSLQAKVMDPSCYHKLLLDTLHNPSCSKAVSVMLSFHGPIILPNMPPSSHTHVKAVLASFSVVWFYFIRKLP